MILEILLGAGLGLILRVVYMRALFAPYPFARYVVTAPLIIAAAALLAFVVERLAQKLHRPRRQRPIYERAFGVALFLSVVLLIEIGKIAGEWSAAWRTVALLVAPVVCVALSLIWIRYRRFRALALRLPIKPV